MWGYWYGDRSVTIETAPADAQLELFYIRKNFQKVFMRATPPVRLKIPNRISATARDALIVRASAPGFKSVESTYNLQNAPPDLVIKLAPLPNTLVGIAHNYLAGRSTLTLRTTKEPQFRVSKSRDGPGFTLSLAETADQSGGVPSLAGGHLRKLEVAQVGEDLLVKVEVDDPTIEVRTKQRQDGVRREHLFVLDLVEKDAPAPSFEQVRRDLERVSFSSGSPCHGRFEAVLREGLDAEVIARATRPSGSIADLYRREAMMLIGRTDHGTVRTASGETLRTGSPIELEMALQGAGGVEGYIALLGAYARTQPEPTIVMRSLLAPDLEPVAFDQVYQRAEAAYSSCGR
jgi:hypothetical protein